jgi:hypothetical protein
MVTSGIGTGGPPGKAWESFGILNTAGNWNALPDDR